MSRARSVPWFWDCRTTFVASAVKEVAALRASRRISSRVHSTVSGARTPFRKTMMSCFSVRNLAIV